MSLVEFFQPKFKSQPNPNKISVILDGHYQDRQLLAARMRAVADMKFTYVVSCQIYGAQKKSSDIRDRSCYLNILNLMLKYQSLRVAYIDEREETLEETLGERKEKVYYSVLVKGGEKLDERREQDEVYYFILIKGDDKLDEEIYRIKLPGPPAVIGEGKPENQNHAIIFTRGEALQTIDMNQDNYLEEAFKVRNVLEELAESRHGHRQWDRQPTILGLREHIFTGSVSSLAWFMSNQETSFVTIGQRILANPLKWLKVTVLTVYVFLYGRLYLVLSGLEKSILDDPTVLPSKSLETALASQSAFQLGLLLVLPMVMEIGLEKGFRKALAEFIIMQLQLASVFFTFQLGTKAHYYGRTILHGGAKYRGTGRGFVVFHAKFADNYRLYSRSHFVKGLELLILLVIYEVYGHSYRSSRVYLFVTFSLWFLVASWLFAPFVFNPSGFEWQKTVDDWTDWKRWMGNRGGIGIQPDRSWESWWDGEQDHLRHTRIWGRVLEILLSLRFLIYQYGIVYHLNISHHSKSLLVYGLSWLVMATVLVVLKMVSMGRRRFGTDFQLMPVIRHVGFWDSIKELARAYEYVMGILIFMPIVILSWFPFVSEFQTRLLFNQAFSRGLQISRILAGKKDGSAPN
ncbi:hypothetical protein ACLOJK_037373 [Asimina triloba]